MSYQIRHKQHGVYQGSFEGVTFWHPRSSTPLLGYHEFGDFVDACNCVRQMAEANDAREEDLTIEEYEVRQSETLQRQGLEIELERQVVCREMMRQSLELWEAAEKMEGDRQQAGEQRATLRKARELRQRALHPDTRQRTSLN